ARRARAPAAACARGASSALGPRLIPTVERLGAARAQTDDGKVGEARAVAEGALDRLAHSVELLARHRKVIGATLAGQVLLLAGDGERMQPGAVPQMDMPNEPDFLEGLQV